MSVQSAQSITVLFSTRAFATGAGQNADSLPSGTLYLNGTSNAATVTVTNISTGLYKAAVTLPTLAIGDIVALEIGATVSSISDKAVIWGDTKDFAADASGFVTANLNGDLTATMKTSVTTAATAATPTAAAVTAGVTVTTNNDKTGYTLSGTQTFNMTGNITGNVSGSVGSVTGSVGSVTGAVGSVTATVSANTTQLAGQTVTAAAGVTFPASVASPTNITGGTITTVTNLTNAPTVGDFTSTMKTSLSAATPTVTLSGDLTATMKTSVTTAATAATPTAAAVTGNVGGNVVGSVGSVSGSVGSVTGAVGSVTGNVGGNVTGSVGSVTGLTASRLDVAVSTRLAASSYVVPPDADDNALALLIYDLSTVTGEADRSLLNAVRFLRNKWSVASNTLTVTKEDDSTTAWTAAITTDAAAIPITGSDPT